MESLKYIFTKPAQLGISLLSLMIRLNKPEGVFSQSLVFLCWPTAFVFSEERNQRSPENLRFFSRVPHLNMLPPPSSRRFPRQSWQHTLPEYRNMRFILFHHQREKTYLVSIQVGCTDLVRVSGGSTKGSTDMNSFVNLGHLRTKYFPSWITSSLTVPTFTLEKSAMTSGSK